MTEVWPVIHVRDDVQTCENTAMALHLTWKPTRQHIERIRSDVERIVLHLHGIPVPPESPGTNGDTAP